MHEIHESAVRGDPGGTTVPARVLNEDQDGRALVLIEDDGEQLHHGDVVTVDTDALKTSAAPAADLPQIAVPCLRCAAPAGELCTSHGGTRLRRHDTHQARRAAWANSEEGHQR